MTDAQYHFLSHVRCGFAASITQPDTFGADQPALAVAQVGVTVSAVDTPVSHLATVRGPGHVTGLMQRHVVRTDPVPGSIGVEPNYFAQIEFDRHDLPWLFTPAAAVGERLRPWIVLVVVDLEGPNACTLTDGSPLPQLTVPTAAAAAQLHDLASSHLWAHAQVITPENQSLEEALTGDPRLSLARLLCPRHLRPNTHYLAAVVPAFDVGRLAGLGQQVAFADEARLTPAWTPGGQTILPVYYFWDFYTGTDADFETLARKIRGQPLPEGVGTRPLDMSQPGGGLPRSQPPTDVQDTQSIVWLDGALRAVNSDNRAGRDALAEKAFRTELTVLLDRPATLVRAGGNDPAVAPPIYGDQHALVVEFGGGDPPPWITELNLNARNRVAAGLGTQVVQARQDDLVNRAWRQLGEVLAANQLLRAAQLSRSASVRIHRRLSTLDKATLLGVASPMSTRVTGVTGLQVSLARAVRDSRLPEATATTAFRRLARPAGVTAHALGGAVLPRTVVTRFASEVFTAPTSTVDGVGTMRPATEVIGAQRAAATLVTLGDSAAQQPGRLDAVLGTLGSTQSVLPSGDDLRSRIQPMDVGAIGLVRSLGAVTASAIRAVLEAATVPAPVPSPIPHQPVLVQPFMHEHPTPVHLPQGLAGPIITAGSSHNHTQRATGQFAFTPPGTETVIDPGRVAMRGGAVILTDDTVNRIVEQDAVIHPINDGKWTQITHYGLVPAVMGTVDPVIDPGTRLDVFRRDPRALSALAQAANGQTGAAMVLDGVAASAVAASAGVPLQSLAAGTYQVGQFAAITPATGPADRAAANRLIAMATEAFDRMVSELDAPPTPAGPILDLAAAQARLLTRIDPEVTAPARIRARLKNRAIVPVPARDALDPIMACPIFLDPMWEAVRDLGNDWLLPGLELVPPDTATLVETNPSFVAACMVGLNHEFMRELLWREYPTDRRGTSFARFWGRTGAQPNDIRPVHQFGGHLLDNLLSGQAGETVLLLRSELLRRYPGSIVYLSKASQQGDDLRLDDNPILPDFHGELPPDVTFAAFPVPPKALRETGDPWWFVIAQPPSKPRFGLDNPSESTPQFPDTANDLAWSHMPADNDPATWAPFAVADPPALRHHRIDATLIWGSSAAVQAHLTYQHPVQVAIRAADLLPPT